MAETDDDAFVCEECADMTYPGVRWLEEWSPNEAGRQIVERCDACARYANDLAAAVVVAEARGLIAAWVPPSPDSDGYACVMKHTGVPFDPKVGHLPDLDDETEQSFTVRLVASIGLTGDLPTLDAFKEALAAVFLDWVNQAGVSFLKDDLEVIDRGEVRPLGG